MRVTFEHVGMTVSDMDRAVGFYRDLLGLNVVVRKSVERGELAFFDSGAGMLEVYAPSAATVDRFRDVPLHEAGLRHITFAVEGLDALFANLVDAGVEVVEHPRIAHNQEMLQRVAFVRDPDGILVELVERAKGRADSF
jgi:glyoxylase I family protein